MAEIELRPRISYPREAQSGTRYLISVDLDHTLPPDEWPYEGEEYPVTCFLDAAPSFKLEAASEPTIVVHRFGGSYGPAQFWLTAGEPAKATIRLTLVNGAGVPIGVRTLDDIVIAKRASEAVVIVRPTEAPAPTRGVPRPVPERVFRWLHLGDLQFGEKEGRRAKPPVAEDLLGWLPSAMHIDAVIVTGDLAIAGRAEEFDRAADFLSHVRSVLSNAQGWWPGLLVVPGNHDALGALSTRARAAVLEWNDRARRARFWSDASDPLRLEVEERFAAYETWRRRIESTGGNRRGILPGDFSVTMERDNFRVGIVGLNDCFLIAPGLVPRLSDVGTEQLAALCGEEWANRHDLRLLLTHHHPSSLRTETRDRFFQQIAPRSSFDVRLYGATHVQSAAIETAQTPSGLSIGCNAARYGAGSQPRGYRVGEAVLSASGLTVRMWPRVENTSGTMSADMSMSVDAAGAVSIVVPARAGSSSTTITQESKAGASSTAPPQAATAPGLSAPQVSAAPVRNRYAILVGVNDYSARDQRLQFCVNDVQAIGAMLERFGYRIMRLLDRQATKAAILNAIDQACRTSRLDDLILFFFSGHASNEAGHSLLMPVDFSDAGDSALAVDEIARHASRRGRRLLMLGDAANIPGTWTPPPGTGCIGGVTAEYSKRQLGMLAVAVLEAFEAASSRPMTVQQLGRAIKRFERDGNRATAGMEVSNTQGALVVLSREIAGLVVADRARLAESAPREQIVRVGMADLDGAASRLDLLAEINKVQDVFAFETVTVKVPDDVWDSVTKQVRYLRADRLAQRITNVMPPVNVLVCLTSQWLRDDDTTNLLSWWSDDGAMKVAVISSAGLDAANADRSLMCQLVAALASMLGGAEVHTDGSKSCPLFYNAERTLPPRLKLDARCRGRLRRTVPHQLPALEIMLGLFERPRPSAESDKDIMTIPVVVHVVYKTNEQNISDAQIRSQIDVLNQDYRARNPDISEVPEPFKPFIGDAQIEFALAHVDPNGNATTGITRTRTTHAAFPSDDTVKRVVQPWDPERFLNIWVCPLASGLLRYSQFPGGPPATDGVVIHYRAFGTIGTAMPPFDKGRSATGGIAMYLNLRHIWGDRSDCIDGDMVADTPPQKGPNYGKPTFPHISCPRGAPYGDMFMNFMDYVDDDAMYMFTKGQVARMRETLRGPRRNLRLG